MLSNERSSAEAWLGKGISCFFGQFRPVLFGEQTIADRDPIAFAQSSPRRLRNCSVQSNCGLDLINIVRWLIDRNRLIDELVLKFGSIAIQ